MYYGNPVTGCVRSSAYTRYAVQCVMIRKSESDTLFIRYVIRRETLLETQFSAK